MSRLKEIKLKDPKSAPLRDNAAELLKKDDKKNKKKKFQSQRQEHIGERKEQILATNVNTTNVLKKKRRGVTLVKSHISIMIKKATLSTTALSQKTSVGLGNLYAND